MEVFARVVCVQRRLAMLVECERHTNVIGVDEDYSLVLLFSVSLESGVLVPSSAFLDAFQTCMFWFWGCGVCVCASSKVSECDSCVVIAIGSLVSLSCVAEAPLIAILGQDVA